MTDTITLEVARKVLDVVDAGLVKGVGKPKPGQMCVEAAVCYALGQRHGDEPTCVSPALRQFKIGLNDAAWSSNAARAKGMRRLALIQLGTAGTLDNNAFSKALAEMTIRVVVPAALRAVVTMKLEKSYKGALEAAAVRCELEGTEEASDAARDAARYAASYAASYAARDAARYAASYAASYAARDAASYAASVASYAASVASYAASDAARDALLSKVAEAAVQILIGLGAAGAQWLSLTH